MSTPSKNILWLSVSRVVSLGLLFLAYAQLFRYLGPEGSGKFQFVLSFVTLFGVVIDFGIQQYVIKKISEDRSKAKIYFHNFLAVEVVMALVVYGAMVGTALFNGYEPMVVKAIMLAGIGIVLHGLTYPFLAVITAHYDLKKAALLNFIASFINFSVIFVTIWLKGSIVMLASQQVIFSTIALVLYYQFIQKYIGPPQVLKGLSKLDLKLVKKIFIAALPFAMLVGFSTVYNRIDVVLITKYLGYTQTGLYTAAYKFFDLIAFFPAVVSHSLYPLFASMMAENKLAEVRTTLERYLRFMSAVALPMATGGMLLAGPIVRILAGEQFAEAANVLAVLVWAPAILFLYIVVNSLVISQLTKFAVVVTGINVVINIVGNLILLPRIGIMGAAIMTLVSESIQGIFYFYFVRRKITKFKFLVNLWQPFIASSVMGVVVFYLRDMFLLIPIAAGVVTYSLVLLLLGFFKKDDLRFFLSLMRKSYDKS